MKKLNVDVDKQIEGLKFIFKKHKLTQNVFSGGYLSSLKGRGIEFSGFRKYEYSDDSSRIDWVASARSNDLLLREYSVEKNMDFVIMLDVSDSMLYSSTSKLKIEYAIELAIALAYMAIDSGSSVGLILFNDKIIKKIYANGSTSQFGLIKNTLLNVKNYGGKFDLSNSLIQASKFTPAGSMLFVISDFIGIKPSWNKVLSTISYNFDVVGCMVRDAIDKKLPNVGYLQVSGPFSDETVIIDSDSIKKDFEKEVQQEEYEIRKAFLSYNLDFLNITTDVPLSELVNKFVKQRRAKL
jgi:uncharacterized protein (DUF58 family)